jgi:glucans biosynthesis protein C
MERGSLAISSVGITPNRLLFIDNLRTMLTALVIVFHLMITYAGTGSWYYTEGREDLISGALGAWFLVVNQGYFMGLFLFVSAYFVPGSYDRKGPFKFLKDRLIRLGLPLAIYSWIVRPLLSYFDPVRFPDGRPAFWSYITGTYFKQEAIFGSGPLWFVEVLLIFSFVYVLWRLLTKSMQGWTARSSQFPRNGVLIVVAILLGIGAFGVRLIVPVGWNFKLLNLQFPFFVQYIAFFVFGIMAYRNNWLKNLSSRTGRWWLGIAGALIFLFWPMAVAGGAIDNGFDFFLGGLHWQAFAYAIWESFLAIAMSIGLVYIFRERFNIQGKMATFLSRNAYTAYVIHEVVIVTLAYLVIGVMLYPLLKWLVVSLVAVPLCFGLGAIIRKLPYADRVL